MRIRFLFYHINDEPRDMLLYEFVSLSRAAILPYNLTNPDTLGASWSPKGRSIWEFHGESRIEDIFADWDNYILLANLEADFLELTYVCIQLACDYVPDIKAAFPDLGEKNLLNLDDTLHQEILFPLKAEIARPVKLLSRSIASFVSNTGFPRQHELLRAVVYLGGASEEAFEMLSYALKDALPFLDVWRIKDSLDPAFVPSIGAALEIHTAALGDIERALDSCRVFWNMTSQELKQV
jgi:hypothetical protein